MRLIDADQFGVVSFQGKSKDFIEGVAFMLDKIDEAPVVEERPTAKWEYNEASMEYFCTNCHNPSIFLNPYCSHCGASMKEEKNGIPTKKNL